MEVGKRNTIGLQSKLSLKPLIYKKASMKVFKVLNWVDRGLSEEKNDKVLSLLHNEVPKSQQWERDKKAAKSTTVFVRRQDKSLRV